MWPDVGCHDIIVIRGRKRLERRLGHASLSALSVQDS